MSLSDIYNRNQAGALYTPINDNTFDFTYGGGGGGGNTPPTVSTAPTFDVKLTLRNATAVPNVFTFDVQNRTYNENATVELNSNTLNDVLRVNPTARDNFQATNRFEIVKKLIEKKILVSIINDLENIIKYKENEEQEYFSKVEKAIQQFTCLVSVILPHNSYINNENNENNDIFKNILEFLEKNIIFYEDKKCISKKIRIVCKNCISEINNYLIK